MNCRTKQIVRCKSCASDVIVHQCGKNGNVYVGVGTRRSATATRGRTPRLAVRYRRRLAAHRSCQRQRILRCPCLRPSPAVQTGAVLFQKSTMKIPQLRSSVHIATLSEPVVTRCGGGGQQQTKRRRSRDRLYSQSPGHKPGLCGISNRRAS